MPATGRPCVGLLDVVPPGRAAAAVLLRLELDPAVGAGQLAVGAVAGGQRGHDEGGVEAEAVGPAGGEGEARDEGHWLEGGLEEGPGAGLRFVGVGGIVVGVDFDGGGAVGVVVPDEFGEMFGDVPVWRACQSCFLDLKLDVDIAIYMYSHIHVYMNKDIKKMYSLVLPLKQLFGVDT